MTVATAQRGSESVIRWTPDRNPATRKIISVDGEGWSIPLPAGIESSNPHVRELVKDAAGTMRERGWHSYVMLAGADDTGYRNSIVHDGTRQEADGINGRNYGLPTIDCLEFLLNLPTDALIVGFYFSYDTTKLLADMPLDNLRELSKDDELTEDDYQARVKAIAQRYRIRADLIHSSKMVAPGSTVWDGYWLSYTPRKELRIIDITAGRESVINKWREADGAVRRAKKPEVKWARQVIVWDVFGFFQSSFLKALKGYRCGKCQTCKTKAKAICSNAPWSQQDLDYIETMKENRGVFTADEQEQILDYCYKECQFLSFLVRDLLLAIDGLDLKLARYDGSGAVASAWMKANRIKDYLPVREAVEIPGEISTDGDIYGYARFDLSGLPEYVALSGYFGGRFEISEIGYMGTLYGNDINSAYPYIASKLPCLAHGRFRRVTEYEPGMFGIYQVGSLTSGNFAPFPFRTAEDAANKAKGIVPDAIYYCHGGKRWIWQDEVAAAIKHFGADAIPVYDGWVWDAACNHKPFATIPDVYRQRQQYVAEGNGIEKAIKLIINSLYGKTAQSIGWNIDRKGDKNPPPFQCFIWAGAITSGCRAMIIDAFMSNDAEGNPADVVSIATDGILSRGKLTLKVHPGKVLGDWDSGIVTDAYLFQSGVYTMSDEDGKQVYKTRGFSAKEVTHTALIDAWNSGTDTVHANPDASRFIPMKSGVSRTDALEYIGQWIPSEHDVSFTHNRRIALYGREADGIMPILETGLAARSEPHTVPGELESAPYSPKQTWDDVMEHQPPSPDYDYIEA